MAKGDAIVYPVNFLDKFFSEYGIIECDVIKYKNEEGKKFEKWDGSTRFEGSPSGKKDKYVTVYGPNSDYPLKLNKKQMMELCWLAVSWSITSDCSGSASGSAAKAGSYSAQSDKANVDGNSVYTSPWMRGRWMPTTPTPGDDNKFKYKPYSKRIELICTGNYYLLSDFLKGIDGTWQDNLDYDALSEDEKKKIHRGGVSDYKSDADSGYDDPDKKEGFDSAFADGSGSITVYGELPTRTFLKISEDEYWCECPVSITLDMSGSANASILKPDSTGGVTDYKSETKYEFPYFKENPDKPDDYNYIEPIFDPNEQPGDKETIDITHSESFVYLTVNYKFKTSGAGVASCQLRGAKRSGERKYTYDNGAAPDMGSADISVSDPSSITIEIKRLITDKK